jgi:hypothetical protein
MFVRGDRIERLFWVVKKASFVPRLHLRLAGEVEDRERTRDGGRRTVGKTGDGGRATGKEH